MVDETPMTELLERMHRGDAIAVHQFYERVEPFLRAVARRSLNPALRRQVDSMDVAESAFRRVLEGSMRAKFESEGRVLGWMATIVRNRIRTLSRKVDAPGGASYLPLLDEGLPGKGVPDPVASASAAEEVLAFQQAMEHLPEAEREVIALRDFEELPFEQVAELMGRPSADAVRKLHGRALKRLRARLS